MRRLIRTATFTFLMLAILALTLPGCLSPKELECLARDNTSNPCH